jgi:hypothetical protein
MPVKKIIGGWLFMFSLATAASVAAEDMTPSGTITIDETQVMLILGGDVGHGTLSYQGNEFKFKSKGLKVGGFGVHKMDLTGEVYDLKDLADFPGLYFEAEVGADMVKGKGDAWLKNDKGTRLHLHSKSEGLALSIGVEGFDIELEDM